MQRYLILFLLFLFIYSACSVSEGNKHPDAIFDGKTFAGWEGNKTFFRIEDQAIVAGSTTEFIPTNQFLCTDLEYADFHLSMEVKFVSRENNAGIQFRSARIPDDHEVIGYQADVGYAGGENVWGSLYDESRRGRFLAKADSSLLGAALDSDGWNLYEVICDSNQIEHWINGSQVLHYEEKDAGIAETGVICVQIHGGKPAEAHYRNINLKPL